MQSYGYIGKHLYASVIVDEGTRFTFTRNGPEVKEVNIHHLAYAVPSLVINVYITHSLAPRIELQYEKVIL